MLHYGVYVCFYFAWMKMIVKEDSKTCGVAVEGSLVGTHHAKNTWERDRPSFQAATITEGSQKMNRHAFFLLSFDVQERFNCHL